MLVISHRGNIDSLPENTLGAFQAAVQLGVDGLESDIRLAADGEVVLYHDRVTPQGRPVASLCRDEISELAGHAVPTLREALDAFPDQFWVLEVKTPRAVEPLIQVLSARLPVLRCVVISFWHSVAVEVRSRLGIDCGVLMSHCPLDFQGSLGADLKAHGVDTLVWNCEFFEPRWVAEARALGYRTMVYCPTTAAEHEEAGAAGVDAVITDYPRICLPPRVELPMPTEPLLGADLSAGLEPTPSPLT